MLVESRKHKILEFGYVVNDVKNIINLHRKQEDYNNIIYFDMIDNNNVCIIIFNNYIDGYNSYVLGIKHNHIFNAFSIEDILNLLKYLTIELSCYVFIKNIFKKLIYSIEDSKILSKLLDVEIYTHYINNTVDINNSSIFNTLIQEKHFKSHLYSVKIDYSIVNILTIIETSYTYYLNFIDLCFSDIRFDENETLNTYVSNFNFLNRMVISGLLYEDSISKFSYYIHSVTKRPTIRNAFNYMNLSKKDNSRERIKSKYKNGVLVEIDFQSFHLQLLDRHLNLFPNKKPGFNYHNEMSKIFFNKEIKTQEDKEQTKKNTFYLLYNNNNVDSNSSVIDTINKFKFTLIEYFISNNRIKSISGGYIYIEEEDDNKVINKIINYFMQDLETNLNLKIIKSMYIDNGNLYDLIMYVYDSFLFDIKNEDLIPFIEYIKNKFAGYVYTLKVGNDYNNLTQYKG